MTAYAVAPPRTPWSYLAIACAIAAAAQVGFVGVFAAGRHAVGRAEIAEPRRDAIAVAVDAVSDLPLLKYGAEHPSQKAGRPSHRAKPGHASRPVAPPAPAKLGPVDPTLKPLPEPSTPTSPADAPTSAASTAPTTDLTSDPASAPDDPSPAAADAGPPGAATTPGSALGSDAGTEIDPLKARAAASYRGQLDAWFSNRFHIRGKLPFDRLSKLSASVVVGVSDARHVISFTIVAPSGDPTFDGQLRADLAAIQASGVELPAPPPEHPELLESNVHLRFACTIRAYCE